MLTATLLEAFAKHLEDEGVSPASVDVTSRAGGDHDTRGSRWKTYYRSAAFPACGVLLAHEEGDGPLGGLLERLKAESVNFDLLRQAGHVVPMARSEVSVVLDHLASDRPAAALVVEHIEGRGPFKGIYPRAFMGLVNEMSEPARSEARQNWARLQAAVGRRAPMDLQFMLEPDGRIVVIDCERTTVEPIYSLQDWDDGARPRRSGFDLASW